MTPLRLFCLFDIHLRKDWVRDGSEWGPWGADHFVWACKDCGRELQPPRY